MYFEAFDLKYVLASLAPILSFSEVNQPKLKHYILSVNDQ